LKVLIVDPDTDIQELCQSWLRIAGFEATAVPDAGIALRRFQEEFFDIVICDVCVRRAEAMELICNLEAIHPRVGVVLAGNLDWKAETAVLPGRVDAFVMKPFEGLALLRIVRELARSLA
jgi:DNA-binding NtrC family response regulator